MSGQVVGVTLLGVGQVGLYDRGQCGIGAALAVVVLEVAKHIVLAPLKHIIIWILLVELGLDVIVDDGDGADGIVGIILAGHSLQGHECAGQHKLFHALLCAQDVLVARFTLKHLCDGSLAQLDGMLDILLDADVVAVVVAGQV